MKLEGILLAKIPYKEKDLICKFLLRNGELFSAYFYGGQGSSKKKTSSILEVGHSLKITLSPSKKDLQSDLQIAKEWEISWHSDHIRKNYKAFYIMNFYSEFLLKISTQFNHKAQFQTSEHEGAYKVLSNALFYLDESLISKNFDGVQHLFQFLSKLALEIGVVPRLDECIFCECELEGANALIFDVKDGGFCCHSCGDHRFEGNIQKSLVEGYSLFKNLNYSLKNKFNSYKNINVSEENVKALLNYICYQFGMNSQDLKSYAVIF